MKKEISKRICQKAVISSLLGLLCVLFSIDLKAQGVVSGRVLDVEGQPLAGVSVVVGDTNKGTSTDFNGMYSISVPATAKSLIFSLLGMEEQVVAIAGRTKIDITLKESSDYIEEIVVVGYGSQKKVHMTGSVVSVSSRELNKVSVSNVSQSLVGKLPGIITRQDQGLPGHDQVSILVRGFSSYNDSGKVLVLVDGVERDMNMVNPADVESISVLKDAAACAVYGMKGANGVILVTTKRGTSSGVTLNYSGKLTLSSPTALPKMMNGTQYMQYYNLGRQLDGGTTFFTEEEIAATYNGDPSDGFENTDWTEPLYRTTTMHNHSLSISGVNSKAKYFISGGFQDQNGIIKNLKNKKTNFRSNVDVTPVQGLTVSLNIGGFLQDFHQPGHFGFENAKVGGTYPMGLLYALPFVPQEYQGKPTSASRAGTSFIMNPEYGAANSGFKDTRTIKIEASSKIEYETPFLKGLKASLFYSWDWTDTAHKSFAYAYKVMAYQFATKNYIEKVSSGLLPDGNMFQSDSKRQYTVLRPQLSYAESFGKHSISALFLYELSQYRGEILSGGRRTFPLLELPELDLGAKETASNAGGSDRTAYAGYVGRFNYVYAEKYLAEVALRYDGSYLFAKENRWGFFPSLSLGWVLSKEDFFRSAMPSVDFFKIRASIGEVGNDNVAPFLYRKNYGFNQGFVALGGTAQNTLYNTVSYPMKDLTWERVRSYDLGLEFNAWKGLFGFEFDTFYKHTYNILNSVSGAYPGSLGGHIPTQENSGEFDNRGFELSMKHSNRVGDFNYKLSANLSYAHNKILKKVQSSNILPWQSVIGHSLGSFWGLQSDGLYQSEEELANAPAPIGVTPMLGDIKYVDYNGDGKISVDDMVKIGRSLIPEMMFAFQFDADWKGIDFSIMFQGAALSDKRLIGSWANGTNDATPLTKPWYANYDNSPLYLVENAWRPDNTNAEYPRLSVSGRSATHNYQISDFWTRNGAYLRLKNMTLGYTLPSKLTRKAHFQNVRFFLSGTNLLTFTEFKYIDPESPNVVTGYYPQQRAFTFGIDLSF